MLLCVALVAVGLAGCGKQTQTPVSQNEQTEPSQTQGSESLEATDPTEEVTEIVNPDAIAVKTVYGTLYYQEQWAEYMKVEQVEDDGCLRVSFLATINGIDYPLFQIYIGEADGSLVGQLTDNEGTQHNVYVCMEEVIEHSELSEAEQNRLYAMQEDINYIIDNL